MARNPLAPVAIVPDDPNPMLAGVPTQADAMDYNSGAVRDWLARQQAQSAQMGLWNDATGLPTQAGMVNAAQSVGNGLLMGSTAPGIRAFHGSPHSFDQFSLDKIGTGEGAQAYGHGLYFAGNEGVARGYRDNLTNAVANGPTAAGAAERALSLANSPEEALASLNANLRATQKTIDKMGTNTPPGVLAQVPTYQQAIDLVQKGYKGGGSMYEVNINADPAHFLDWDKPLSGQHPVVQEGVNRALRYTSNEPVNVGVSGLKSDMTGADIVRNVPDQAALSQALAAHGIPGIRYLDGGSRGAGEGTSNTVVFDPATIEILRKYGIAGLMAGGTAAASQ